jgi:hypothetical protein
MTSSDLNMIPPDQNSQSSRTAAGRMLTPHIAPFLGIGVRGY